MDTSNRPQVRDRREPARPLVMVGVAVAVIGFGLVTAIAQRPSADVENSITPAALPQPEIEPGFRVVTELAAGPWDPYRIDGGYLAMDVEATVITDDDQRRSVQLPDIEVLFGAIDAGSESIAYGRTSLGPAIWRSSDTLTWTLEQLPWTGTVRAAAVTDDGLRLIGIATSGATFSYVMATETPNGWMVEETSQIPNTGLTSVPGGFVGRGSATDNTGYGYLFSDNGLDWTFQSTRAIAAARSAGQLPVFVSESPEGPELRIPGREDSFSPPGWPVSGVWLETDTIWVQTSDAAWSSLDGVEWTEYPIDVSTGVEGGFSVLIPEGATPRVAAAVDGRISLLRWDPGSVQEG